MLKKTIYGMTILTAISGSIASAESVPGTDFNVHFESSNIVGTGRSINMHRVPVVSESTGKTTYYDVSFKLSFDANNQLVFDGFSQTGSAAITASSNFIPGFYVSSGGTSVYEVAQGAEIQGRMLWSIVSTNGDTFNATWATGSAAENPLIKNESILTSLAEGLSYGILGSERFNFPWSTGDIISASQTGNNLTITSHDSNGAIADSFTLRPATSEQISAAFGN